MNFYLFHSILLIALSLQLSCKKMDNSYNEVKLQCGEDRPGYLYYRLEDQAVVRLMAMSSHLKSQFEKPQINSHGCLVLRKEQRQAVRILADQPLSSLYSMRAMKGWIKPFVAGKTPFQEMKAKISA